MSGQHKGQQLLGDQDAGGHRGGPHGMEGWQGRNLPARAHPTCEKAGQPRGQPPAQSIRHLHGAGAGCQPVGKGQDQAQ